MSYVQDAGEPIGWGIIGTGWMSRTHMVDAINSAPSSRVVAVHSSSPERAKEFAEEFGIPGAYSSVDSMLADPAVDAVFVSSTNELHKPQTLAAAAAGRHVLCEKPLSTTVEDALEMVDACRAAGVVLGTNHYRRLKTTIQTVRRLIAEGVIGDPVIARATSTGYLNESQQTWRLTSVASGGGVMLDIGVHDVDVLRYLLDDEVDEVSATTAHTGLLRGELEDVAVTTLRFRNGAVGTSTVSFCTPGAIGSLEVMGSKGTILANDLLGDKLGGQVYLRRGGSDLEQVDVGPEAEHYTEAVRMFNAAIRGEGRQAVSGEDGVRSLSVALGALRSAELGRAVKIPELVASAPALTL